MQARFVSVAASAVIHVVLVGAALVVAGTVAAPPQVIFLELTEFATPPSPESPPAVPAAVQPPKPPKALAAARPEPPAHRAEPTPIEVPPAPAIVPTPALPAPPVATAPPAPTITPLAPADPATPSSGSGEASSAMSTPPSAVTPNAAAGGAAATPPAPAVAALPRDGSPQRVIPRAVEQYRPAYPASARKARIQGTTLLAVLIADDGRVTEIVVKESAGHPDLDEAAANAVRRWRFTPARRGNDPVAMWVELPVEFRLR